MKKALIATLVLASAAVAPAATITLSAGFGAGLTPPLPAFVAIGSYIGFDPTGASIEMLVTEFDVFATGTLNTKLSGDYTGSDPQFNNADIFVFIGDGTSVGNSTNVAIFKTTSNFPVNVVPAGGQIISTGSTAFIEQTLAGTAGTTIALVPAGVPEPSVAILGALGLLGLVRRRR